MKQIDIKCQGSTAIDYKDLVPFQGDLKDLSKANYQKLRKEILELGFSEPISVWTEGGNKILNGHQRLRVIKQMVEKEGYACPPLPVNVVQAKDEKEAKRKILALTSQYGTMTIEGLEEFMVGTDLTFPEISESFVFPELNIDKFLAINQPLGDDVAPERPAIPTTKPGELWELGQHRLLCGDATDKANVNILLGGEEPFLMVTDPPYGVDYDPEWRNEAAAKGHLAFAAARKGKVANDDQVDWTAALSLFKGDVSYVWHDGCHTSEVQRLLEALDFEIRSQIIWAKPNFAISRGHYHWKHEPCWYAVRKGATAKWSGDRSQTTLWEISQISGQLTGADTATDHSTQKPVELMARPIRNHGTEEDAVYDPFVGSGTTLIACEQLKRRCFAMEIDPGYCDVVIARWEHLTGAKAKLLTGPIVRKHAQGN